MSSQLITIPLSIGYRTARMPRLAWASSLEMGCELGTGDDGGWGGRVPDVAVFVAYPEDVALPLGSADDRAALHSIGHTVVQEGEKAYGNTARGASSPDDVSNNNDN
jgi:hypothetical protein